MNENKFTKIFNWKYLIIGLIIAAAVRFLVIGYMNQGDQPQNHAELTPGSYGNIYNSEEK